MKIWEKIKNEPIIFMFRKMWKFSKGSRDKVILYSVLSVFANLVPLLSPVIFGFFLNEIQFNGISDLNINFLVYLLLGLVLIRIIRWSFHGPSRVIEKKNAFIVRKNYQMFLKRNIIKKSIAWHGDRDSGDLIDKINNSSSSIFNFSSASFIAIQNMVRLTGTIVAISFFSPHIAVVIILFTVVPFIVMNKFDKKLSIQFNDLNKFKNKISAKIFDIFSNVTSIIVLNSRNLVINDIEKTIESPKKLFIENSKLNEWKWFSVGLVAEMFVILPLIFYLIYNYNNNIVIEVGTITMLYMYLGNFTKVFSSLSSYYEKVMIGKVDILNIKEIENSFSDNKNIEKKEIRDWEKLKIKDLNFKYDSVAEDILHLDSVSLEIKKGEKVAFIGKSGSGKTTFLKVIHGLYENAKSEISLKKSPKGKTPRQDLGVKWQETNFADLDLKTMLVPQEPELFSSSIRENVTFGLDYSDTEIEKVLELSQFLEVLENLPKGLNSVVNEKGVNLSGGQKQRLALARALLFSNEKEIILLDESTSSVDPKSEVKIYKNIFKEFSGKTFLASIHKMNLLKYFDRIVIFENGKIVEDGTFEELYGRNSDFKKQWDEYVKEK